MHEPRPEPAVPACPPELNSVARREWARLSEASFRNSDLITHLDRGALATYCGAYAMWAEAMEQIQSSERWSSRRADIRYSHPIWRLLIDKAELMMRIASEFGFTPASRSRIAAPLPDQLPLFDGVETKINDGL